MSASKPKLLYFNIRGRAESIRLALHDIGVEYDEEHPAAWRDVKEGLYKSGKLLIVTVDDVANLNLCFWCAGEAPFGQLPVYYTGEAELPTIVQMNSILRFIGACEFVARD